MHSSGSRTDDPSHHLVTKSSVTTTISVEIATAYPEVVANDTERNQHRMAVNILDQISGMKSGRNCYHDRLLLTRRIGNMQAQSATEDRPDRLVSWLDGTNQTDLLYPARTARSWPSRRLSYLRGDNGAKTQTSIHLNGVARAASRSRVESRVANVDPVFREEIDAHVEQERLDWAEELPLE